MVGGSATARRGCRGWARVRAGCGGMRAPRAAPRLSDSRRAIRARCARPLFVQQDAWPLCATRLLARVVCGVLHDVPSSTRRGAPALHWAQPRAPRPVVVAACRLAQRGATCHGARARRRRVGCVPGAAAGGCGGALRTPWWRADANAASGATGFTGKLVAEHLGRHYAGPEAATKARAPAASRGSDTSRASDASAPQRPHATSPLRACRSASRWPAATAPSCRRFGRGWRATYRRWRTCRCSPPTRPTTPPWTR